MLRICQGTIWLEEYIIPQGGMSTKKAAPKGLGIGGIAIFSQMFQNR